MMNCHPSRNSSSGAVRHKTGRAKSDFELREISKEEYEKLKSLALQENFLLAS
jgi:hypothetical protein